MNGSGRAAIALGKVVPTILSNCKEDNKCLVLDFGAGEMLLNQSIQEHRLSSILNYIPVDVVKRYEQTVVCDLNLLQLPLRFLSPHLDISPSPIFAFFLGSFEYVLDKIAILRYLGSFRGLHVILQYNFGRSGKGNGYQWVTPISLADFAEVIEMINGTVVFDAVSMPSSTPSFAFVSFDR